MQRQGSGRILTAVRKSLVVTAMLGFGQQRTTCFRAAMGNPSLQRIGSRKNYILHVFKRPNKKFGDQF